MTDRERMTIRRPGDPLYWAISALNRKTEAAMRGAENDPRCAHYFARLAELERAGEAQVRAEDEARARGAGAA